MAEDHVDKTIAANLNVSNNRGVHPKPLGKMRVNKKTHEKKPIRKYTDQPQVCDQ